MKKIGENSKYRLRRIREDMMFIFRVARHPVAVAIFLGIGFFLGIFVFLTL